VQPCISVSRMWTIVIRRPFCKHPMKVQHYLSVKGRTVLFMNLLRIMCHLLLFKSGCPGVSVHSMCISSLESRSLAEDSNNKPAVGDDGSNVLVCAVVPSPTY
jgi:hypothetical protein